MLSENDASGTSINLLSDEVVTIARNRRLSLADLLAAMARDEVRGFVALRPHQRAAWHMFLVQLAAVALWRAGRSELPKAVGDWRALLRGLTPEYSQDEPWCLVVGDRAKPAFMQPPDPGGLKWSQVATPDALDMLITSRNHDLKTQVARHAKPEDWVFALVSLQTMEGYGGAGNQGIARMNGGASSRPLLGLAPAGNVGESPDPSRWWGRDVKRLLVDRRAGNSHGPGQDGGPALIWCQSWPEGQQIDLSTLDPLFIEICRRVRLTEANGRITSCRSTSKKARIDAKAFNGAIGDPWAPVHKTKSKSFTLGEEGSFTFKRLVELLFQGDWELPLLARVGPDESQNMLLIAEALSRGNSKTGGLKTRVIPVPRHVLPMFQSPQAAEITRELIEMIASADGALCNGLVLVAARGDRDKAKKKVTYSFTISGARRKFDRQIDAAFFPALWEGLAAAQADQAEQFAARSRFAARLVQYAKVEFNAALPTIPCTNILRPRAEARAHQAFWGRLRKQGLIQSIEGANEET